MKVFSFILIIGLFYVPVISLADNEIQLQDSDINVTTYPDNPEPYDDITITLKSYATDLNSALIQWQSGSKTLLSGYGKTSYSFKALGPNTTTIFTVSITPAGSIDTVTKQIAISPSEVEILWESIDGYTPPFYKGKSFISAEGTIKAVAIPNTSTIKQGKGNIVYNWKENDSPEQSASGYNKDSYVFTNSELNSKEDVTVTASSIDGQYNATKTIEVPIINPKILFYLKSPTEGTLYNTALSDDTFVSGDEATMVAEPYFLALKGKENIFTYSWKINGDGITTPSNPRELTIRPTSRGGYATIDIVMENLNTLYQKVAGHLKIDL